MTPPSFAVYFTCLFLANMAHLSSLKQLSLYFESADVGDSVTLQCVCQDNEAVMFYWYKQTLGQKPKLMSTLYKHNNNGSFTGEFNNPRFSLDTGNSENNLKISHLHISDSATYYCVRSNLYEFEFCEGTTVTVQDSCLNIQASVHQSGSETIQPGGSVTLNCTVHTGTCDGEHSVYWFKDSEESHPGLIYTHGGRNDQCERKSNTQPYICDYNLPMQSLNLSHAGTYYCAVASCGRILFGNGTKLDVEDGASSVVLVYFLSGALALTSILVVFLAFSVYKIYKRNFQCTGKCYYVKMKANAENLHYAALKAPTVNRSRRQRDDTLGECVYSSVRQ
uniref:Immunoglobulin kappa light chain-like n=1 Tax=Seriola lalandi dorsalis TaxID=1841481 RepID=A0A3B4YHQ7_SERLL